MMMDYSALLRNTSESQRFADAAAQTASNSARIGPFSEINSLAQQALDRASDLQKRVSMIADDLLGPAPEAGAQLGGREATASGRLASLRDTLTNINARLSRLDDTVTRLGNLS